MKRRTVEYIVIAIAIAAILYYYSQSKSAGTAAPLGDITQ